MPDATPKPKGHWPKGRSRNLSPSQTAAARVLVDLLRRAIDKPWRHPALGPLTGRGVAGHLKVDPKTVRKWLDGTNLPPLWACDELRALLREFKP